MKAGNRRHQCSNKSAVKLAFDVVRSANCDSDLEAIFDYQFATYQALGETGADAFERAAARVLNIKTALEAFGKVPFQETLEAQIMDGLRHVTKDRAIFYFTVDEAVQQLRVLAIFFGGQDHRTQLLDRIKAGAD